MAARARGSQSNPANRFERLHRTAFPGGEGPGLDEQLDPRTELWVDHTRSIIATNQSPDVGFDASVNPYRGCEHGCAYCYARPTHEYLGLSAGLDFETKIGVKLEAPALLRRALLHRRWQPKTIAFSGVTDPYQPAERKLRITHGCLEVLAEFRNPVALITKNAGITRDLDLLGELARHDAVSVLLSVPTLSSDLAARLEPRASRPRKRLRAAELLAEAGVPVGVMIGPVIPGLTDHEIPKILQAASDAGASFASHVVLRLPHAVKPLFLDWLDQNEPERKEKVVSRLRALHGPDLYRAEWGQRQRGGGLFAQQIRDLFELWRRKTGLAAGGPELSTAAFRRPGDDQLALFASEPAVDPSGGGSPPAP